MHKGYDFTSAGDINIRSIGDGTVAYKIEETDPTYGNMVIIKHS